MKYESLFSRKIKIKIINLSSTEFAHRVVMVEISLELHSYHLIRDKF